MRGKVRPPAWGLARALREVSLMKVRRRVGRAAATLAALSVVLVTALAAGAAAHSGSAAPGPSRLAFTDPTGDAGSGPDLTKVEVVGDATTQVFAVSVTAPGNQPASPDGLVRVVLVWLDTDSNSATGDGGADYMLHAEDDPADSDHWWDVSRWDGASWVSVPYAAPMSFVQSGDVLTWRLSTAQVGGASSFVVAAGAIAFDASENVVAKDRAPDSQAWVYSINGPTRVALNFVRPVIGQPRIAPARAQAGRRLTVTMPVTWLDAKTPKPLTKGTMICNPSVSGRSIPHTESFTNGVARLSFVVPKTAKGKRVTVKVTIKPGSWRGEDGTFIDIANGRYGLVSNVYSGTATTKVVTIPVR